MEYRYCTRKWLREDREGMCLYWFLLFKRKMIRSKFSVMHIFCESAQNFLQAWKHFRSISVFFFTLVSNETAARSYGKCGIAESCIGAGRDYTMHIVGELLPTRNYMYINIYIFIYNIYVFMYYIHIDHIYIYNRLNGT